VVKLFVGVVPFYKLNVLPLLSNLKGLYPKYGPLLYKLPKGTVFVKDCRSKNGDTSLYKAPTSIGFGYNLEAITSAPNSIPVLGLVKSKLPYLYP